MKKIIIYPIVALFLLAASVFTFVSCEDFLADPLVDKDTGEDLTMLLVDMNFIKTKLAIYLEDYDTGEAIEGPEIEIFIGGESASNLINFAGVFSNCPLAGTHFNIFWRCTEYGEN